MNANAFAVCLSALLDRCFDFPIIPLYGYIILFDAVIFDIFWIFPFLSPWWKMVVGLVRCRGVLVKFWVEHCKALTRRPIPAAKSFGGNHNISPWHLLWCPLLEGGLLWIYTIVTSSFCVESWAHDIGSKFNAEVDAFPLKLLPSLPFFHFELRNLVGILNQWVFLLPFFVSSLSSVFCAFLMCSLHYLMCRLASSFGLACRLILWLVLPLRNLLEMRQCWIFGGWGLREGHWSLWFGCSCPLNPKISCNLEGRYGSVSQLLGEVRMNVRVLVLGSTSMHECRSTGTRVGVLVFFTYFDLRCSRSFILGRPTSPRFLRKFPRLTSRE